MATHPYVWHLVQIDAEGNRELLGVHATTEERSPQPDDKIEVGETTYRVVATEPANSDAPHVGPQRIEGMIIVVAQD